MSASLRALALLASLASVAGQPSSEAYTAPPAPAFTCCTGSACTGGVSNDAATCAALGELYAATAGAIWSLHTSIPLSSDGWKLSSMGVAADFCAYPGCVDPGCASYVQRSPFRPHTVGTRVVASVPPCNAAGQLTALLLSGANLVGPIPSSLATLTNLVTLNIKGSPALSGCVPASVYAAYNSTLGGNTTGALAACAPAPPPAPPSPPPPPSPAPPPFTPPCLNENNGVNNVITGCGNIVDGNNNKVNGDGNVIIGSEDYVKGDVNTVLGNADLVDGDENSIYAGAYDAVYGDGNDLTYTASDIIHGNKNAVHHNSPTKGGTSARIQVFGSDNVIGSSSSAGNVTGNVVMGNSSLLNNTVLNSFAGGQGNVLSSDDVSDVVFGKGLVVKNSSHVTLIKFYHSVVLPVSPNVNLSALSENTLVSGIAQSAGLAPSAVKISLTNLIFSLSGQTSGAPLNITGFTQALTTGLAAIQVQVGVVVGSTGVVSAGHRRALVQTDYWYNMSLPCIIGVTLAQAKAAAVIISGLSSSYGAVIVSKAQAGTSFSLTTTFDASSQSALGVAANDMLTNLASGSLYTQTSGVVASGGVPNYPFPNSGCTAGVTTFQYFTSTAAGAAGCMGTTPLANTINTYYNGPLQIVLPPLSGSDSMSWSTPIPVRSNYPVYITCPDKSCTFTGVYAPFFSLSSSSGSIYYYGINFVHGSSASLAGTTTLTSGAVAYNVASSCTFA